MTVERRYWGLSTYIKAPSPLNANQFALSNGLCGNNNGDPEDDFAPDFFESNRYLLHIFFKLLVCLHGDYQSKYNFERTPGKVILFGVSTKLHFNC